MTDEIEDWGQRPKLLWLLVACVFFFVVWALLFPLDVASYAQGQVIPAGQLKRVQHLEGGIVQEIRVVEGQQVSAGAVIAELEDVAVDADVGDLGTRAAATELQMLRILAQLEGKSQIEIPEELASDYPQFAREARAAFFAGVDRYRAMVAAHEAKIQQREAEIEEARQRLAGLEIRGRYVGEQVAISESMLKENLTNEYEHLQLMKEQAQIEADRLSTNATERRARTALAEANAALAAFRSDEHLTMRKELQTASTELASLRERLRKPADSRDRTTVRAPVAGSIMMLYFKNQGAVVPPGGTIATLVPEGEDLLIEAKLPIGEVGYVNPGARARISIAAGGSGFSSIDAVVVHVSPDAVMDETTGASHYIVRLQPEEMAFRRGEERYALRPGVQVMAAILTGERSVMAVLLDPFIGSSIRPLSER